MVWNALTNLKYLEAVGQQGRALLPLTPYPYQGILAVASANAGPKPLHD